MVPFFIENLVPVIHEMIGFHLANGSWALVTTPMRRHKEHNFASRIAEGLAAELGIPFYFDCAHCRSKQRIGAVFDANNIPREGNVIVFDDFVTTGSTLQSMKNLLLKEGKIRCISAVRSSRRVITQGVPLTWVAWCNLLEIVYMIILLSRGMPYT